jgi:hypothetical protein
MLAISASFSKVGISLVGSALSESKLEYVFDPTLNPKMATAVGDVDDV